MTEVECPRCGSACHLAEVEQADDGCAVWECNTCGKQLHVEPKS